MFPRFSYDTFLLPRHEGGLSVLNASIQQLSLQFRWIMPLFFTSHPHHSFVHSWILYSLNALCQPHDGILCLLFPSLRPSSFNFTTSLWGLFGCTINICPCNSFSYNPSIALLLCLLLDSIISLSPSSLTLSLFPKLRKYRLAVAYAYYVSSSNILARKPHAQFPHCNTIIAFFRYIDQSLLFL